MGQFSLIGFLVRSYAILDTKFIEQRLC